MEDRFLFRGYDKDEFYYEWSIYDPCPFYPEEMDVIEQCTGLKDKNGKLSFSKDKVKGHDGSIWIVDHVNGGFVFYREKYYGQKNIELIWESLTDPQSRGYFETQCEIIGNIHDGE